MSLEPELKFRVTKGKLRGLANSRIAGAQFGRGEERELVSTYFDTPKQKLHRHGITLRVREVGDQHFQTVKTSTAGSFARGEWEAEIQKSTPDFRELRATPLAHLATKKLNRKIVPTFRTSVRRLARPFQVGPSEIELAVDRGNLAAGGSTEPITEFELELKKGRPADLFRVARSFVRRTGAELDLRSKADQGYRLVNGDMRGAVRAEPVHLTRKMTAGEAFDVIAYSTLRHFSANADAVRAMDAEAIHQMRVGSRRLRAAISLFADILPGASTTRLKTELKWLTGELAPAREIDVFMKDRIKPMARAVEPKRGGRAIERDFSARRKDAFRQARRALETQRYRNLLIDIIEWLESRKPEAKDAEARIGPFADDLLKRRIQKVRKQARHLETMSPRARHKLRIKIKKIRYAVDFFRSRYPKKAQVALDDLSAHLKEIQHALGALNDFNAHGKMAVNAALHAPRRNRRARAFASGLLVGEEREASKTLMKAALKEFRHLRPLRVAPTR
jgi:triphosphatase